MRYFKGMCLIVINNKEYEMSFNILDEGRYFFKGNLKSEKNIHLNQNDLLDVSLKNVRLIATYGSFSENDQKEYFKELITDLFIYKYNANEKEVYLLSRKGYIEFDSLEEHKNHLIEFSDFNMNTLVDLHIKNFRAGAGIVNNGAFIASSLGVPKLNQKDIEIFIYAMSYLKGARIVKKYEHVEKELKIHISSKKESSKINPVVSNYYFSGELVNRVFTFFDSLTEEEQKKWFRIYSRNINSRSTSECISDFNFFEANRENSNQSFAKVLEEVFGLNEKESKFIKKLRIGLVHDGLFLDECIEKNLGILRSCDGKLSKLMCTENKIETKAILFSLYMEELSNMHIAKNLPKVFYDFEYFKRCNSFGCSELKFNENKIENEDILYKDYTSIYNSLGVNI